MLHSQSKRMADIILPICNSLSWEAEHQINTNVIEAYLLGRMNRFNSPNCIMPAMQETKTSIRKGLHPYAKAIDTKMTQLSKIIRSQIVRVPLYGNFCAILHIIYII